MKIYKISPFKAVEMFFLMIFRPQGFKRDIARILIRYGKRKAKHERRKMNHRLIIEREQMQQEFNKLRDELDQKLRKIEFKEKRHNGITASDRMDVLHVPILGVDRVSRWQNLPPTADGRSRIFGVDLHKLTHEYSYSCPEISLDVLKQDAAYVLADKLIKSGFLQSRIDNRVVTFYINTYEQ